jgi:hypothetical protein
VSAADRDNTACAERDIVGGAGRTQAVVPLHAHDAGEVFRDVPQLFNNRCWLEVAD